MSGGACVVAMTEALKLNPPSTMLENCLRQVLQNPLVVERVNEEPDGLAVYKMGRRAQWSAQDQAYVQGVLQRIVKADLGDTDGSNDDD